MRNLLMTVMMLAVVAVLFVTIVTSENGLRDGIQEQGSNSITRINNLSPGED